CGAREQVRQKERAGDTDPASCWVVVICEIKSQHVN
ncbi:hypothetical protein scyTo_0021657, partial [Scyliorhinus torazame]|nr:hypothetical protein [Scyliorhinus torazame]